MSYLDSHCHLNDEAFDNDLDLEIKAAQDAGVKAILVLGYDLDSSIKAIKIAESHEGVYAAVGYHPQNLEDVSEENILKIKELAANQKVIAIGEVGLDYHWYKKDEVSSFQKKWLIRQIDLANELNLPMSIHARDALEDIYEVLKDHPIKANAVLHCYSGSPEMMEKFNKLNLYYGFDGPITYKNAKTPKECVKICPLNKILSETDSPYLSPTPHRGERNGPKYIPHIVSEIASIKDLPVEVVEKAISINFKNLFGVDE